MESTFLCVVCGNEFTPGRVTQRFCSRKCRNREDKDDRRFSGVRDYVVRRDAFKCVTCGTSEKLTVHHKDWIRTNNDPTNLITLCRSCHRKEHFDTVDLDKTKACVICGGGYHPMKTKVSTQVLCKRRKCLAEYKKIQKRSEHGIANCKICGNEFTQKHSQQLCCSEGCTKINNDRGKAERYATNREGLIAKQKSYYASNKEERLLYIKNWQRENTERVKTAKARSAEKNRDRRNARARELYSLKKFNHAASAA